MDLQDLPSLKPKIERILAHHNPLRRGLGQPEISADDLCAQLTEIAPKILPYVDTVWALLDRARRQGKRILFEGAQGALLDIDHGTYPFVTSSNTVAAQAATGSGVGPGAIGYVLGITKAYTTRVGEGPFPTELKDETGKLLGERGVEFGTVTGRPRRCGWFDACLVRQTRKVAGINGIALTKLDVLDQLPELKICVGYRLDGLPLDHLPAAQGAQARVVPIYETMEGWTEFDARRADLGRASRAMHQICAAARGADRRAGGAALDQPEARGHHPRARSFRGLDILLSLPAWPGNPVSPIARSLRSVIPGVPASAGMRGERGGAISLETRLDHRRVGRDLRRDRPAACRGGRHGCRHARGRATGSMRSPHKTRPSKPSPPTC